jgi:type II secretion system protein C
MLMLAFLLAAAAAPDVNVVGVVVSPQAAESVAIVQSRGQTRIVKVGESAFGGRVARVAHDSVAFEFADQRVDVRVRASGLPAGPSRTAAAEPAPAAEPASGARTMAREDVQRRLAEETPRILSETAIAPVTDGGQVRGFALTRIPAGANLLADAGLRAGDVVTEINGTAIDSLPTLIGLWPRLQNEKEIRATVLRNGQPMNLSVTLR